jgi:hypothetical protein
MEEILSELNFHLSCQTKALKCFSVFLSAYPGFIVFGKTFTNSYNKQNYFKFSVFEIYKLYIAIIQILNYLTEENPTVSKDVILERDQINKTIYYWRGVKLLINGQNKKFIFFGIEKEDSERNEIPMTLLEVHNFIKALKSSIIISLCLKNLENDLLICASNLEINTLKKLTENSERKLFVENFLKKYTDLSENEEIFKLTELILYYFEIILILHKFSSMCAFDENIFEEILSAK